MITIVNESPEHQDAICRITETAFTASQMGYHGEADLIDSIRSDDDRAHSLVAIQDSEVIGHILFSPARIQFGDRVIHGMGLAPMSVLPTRQHEGIGSLLVTTGLRNLADLKTAFTLVYGDPGFYSRFGFKPASDFGITHGFAGMPQDLFLVHADNDERLCDFAGGLAYYHAALGLQHGVA